MITFRTKNYWISGLRTSHSTLTT